MADHPTIGIDDHGVAEIMQGEVMTAAQFYPLVFEELSELLVGDESFLLHGNLHVRILKPLWTPKTDREVICVMLTYWFEMI